MTTLGLYAADGRLFWQGDAADTVGYLVFPDSALEAMNARLGQTIYVGILAPGALAPLTLPSGGVCNV